MANILLVEDEVNIASFIMRGLDEFGHHVTVAYDGKSGLDLAQSNLFDLLIVDIIMPKMNGLDLCKTFRQNFGYEVPIMLLTALSSTDNIVDGLDAGADDYLVKPFSFQELEARIKALLRRKKVQESLLELKCADLFLNCNTRKAKRGDCNIDLTSKEYRLLEYFLTHQAVAISRQTLVKEVWDKNFDTNTNIVDVYVNYLRSKVDKEFSRKLIHTVVGVGYMMIE